MEEHNYRVLQTVRDLGCDVAAAIEAAADGLPTRAEVHNHASTGPDNLPEIEANRQPRRRRISGPRQEVLRFVKQESLSTD